jgi:CDK-activating kinase assembly factor MAT1
MEDLFYEQDLRCRKKVLGVMNQTLEDFNKNEEEYNKFLEEIENLSKFSFQVST